MEHHRKLRRRSAPATGRRPQPLPAPLVGEGQPAPKLSDQLEAWLGSDGEKTAGTLVERFREKSFAILFVLLLGVPALPLPTGGATHVMEVIAALLALELIAGRREIWLPERWRKIELGGGRRQRFIASLMRLIRRLERISRPRLSFLFHLPGSRRIFGLLVLGGCAGAFLAPPFTGLDTLPALGVVLLSLAMLFEDSAIAATGLLLGIAGVVLEIAAGRAAVHSLSGLF